MSLPENLKTENLRKRATPSISAVPEEVAAERAKNPVMTAGHWDTAKRIPLRTFLSIATTDHEQRARMATKLSRFGLGEGAQVSADPGGNLMVTDADGKVTPLDPDTFGRAETFADVAEELRAVPAAVGSVLARAAAFTPAMATGTAPVALPAAGAVGAAGGEAARQGFESAATHAILGEPSAQTTGERAADLAVAAGGELIFPVAGKAIRGVGRLTQALPDPGYRKMLTGAQEAARSLLTRAKQAGIEGYREVQLGVGETMGPIYRNVVNQLRNLTNYGSGAQRTRSNVVYQLVSRASKSTPEEQALLRQSLEEHLSARRREGVQLVRDLTRARGTMRSQDLFEVAKERTRLYRNRMQEETRANYAAAAEALRDTGATLKYDARGALQHIDRTIPLRAVQVKDPVSGALYTTALPEDLGPKLSGVQRQIRIGQRDGWRTLYYEGREATPEDRLHKIIMDLDDIREHYSDATSKNRGALRVIDGVRDEISGALQNPDVLNGEPALVQAAKLMRVNANRQFGQYRDVMSRLEATDLVHGGNNAATFFNSFTKGGGDEYLDILQNAPEIREAVVDRYASAAELNPEEWADQVLKTKRETWLGILGGDTPQNHAAYQELRTAAALTKSRSDVIAKELQSEVSSVRAAGNVLFGPNRDAAEALARETRDLAPDDPARMRVGAAIVARIFDRAKSESSTPHASVIDHTQLGNALRDMRERGLVSLIPEDARTLLNEVEAFGEAAPGSGGMAMGLVSAEAGASIRRSLQSVIAVGLAASTGIAAIGAATGSPTAEKVGIGGMVGIGGLTAASELAAILMTGRGTAGALRTLNAAHSPTARLAAQAALLTAVARQSIVGHAMRTRRKHAEDRRTANEPVPAGL